MWTFIFSTPVRQVNTQLVTIRLTPETSSLGSGSLVRIQVANVQQTLRLNISHGRQQVLFDKWMLLLQVRKDITQ